jgi:hypothetical protein
MGKQVADNTEYQVVITLEETPDGRFYMPHRLMGTRGLVKGEYHPNANSLVFPREWGKKRGTTHFLNHIITDVQLEIQQSQRYLAKLQALKGEVDGWPDDLGWNEVPR